MGKIPKPKKTQAQDTIKKPPFLPSDSSEKKVTFSFLALEKTKYFNLDVTCPNWPSELFDMLKNASNFSVKDLIGDKLKTYRVHNHEKASPPDKLPVGVALKDCYQIRISKSKGGIHGVFYEDVFYVIWFDPLHNMYPDDRYGGSRVVSPPTTCCMDRDAIIDELQKKITQLKEDCQFWENEAISKG